MFAIDTVDEWIQLVSQETKNNPIALMLEQMSNSHPVLWRPTALVS